MNEIWKELKEWIRVEANSKIQRYSIIAKMEELEERTMDKPVDHVCPTIVELIEKYQKLENKYDKLADRLDEVFVKIRERESIPNRELSKNEIEPAVRNIIDEVIEEKQRMGEWP